jgi:hypothetical protein
VSPSAAQADLPYRNRRTAWGRDAGCTLEVVRRRTLPLATVLLAVAALALTAGPAAAATTCPSTFHVLHDDHVGAMSLPAGHYTVSVSGLSCGSASKLLARFLGDYDGTLPFPWVANVASRSFTRGSGPAAFAVRRGGYPPAPPRPPTPGRPRLCPGAFSVLGADRIGALAFPKGAYQLRLLGPRLSCQRAAQWFAQFLDDYDGNLPRPWTIGALGGRDQFGVGAVFNDLPGDTGFSALRAGARTGGGGHTPSGGTSCGTFSVLHDDHIGSLYLPKGPYRVSLLQGDRLTCGQATRLLARFLAAATLPAPWNLDAATGIFTRGLDAANGFRIKPASVRVVR